MKNVNRKQTTAVKYPRTRRNHPIMHLSSCMPGVAHPVAMIPMLREDALSAQLDCVVEMAETRELLMNRVNARFTAWVVPTLAQERFNKSREELDRSYMGEESLAGTGVLPYVLNMAVPVGGAGGLPLWKSMGLHAMGGQVVNADYMHAYNLIYNHRARQASKELTPRALADGSLAPAFWMHRQFPHMVADFDQAMMDGQVALTIADANLPVARYVAGEPYDQRIPVKGDGQEIRLNFGAELNRAMPGLAAGGIAYSGGALAANTNAKFSTTQTGLEALLTDVYAEMSASGATISLAGLEEARKLQSFAKLRQRFEGHGEEYVIDMLMQGLSIPDQHLKDPFQIAEQTVTFAQGKRYATDSGNLDDSATSGFARASLRLRVPRIETGGLVVVLMEILPEQLWERQQDWFFHTRPAGGRPAHDFWPDAERDTLDREKVDVVYNSDIDVSHSDPSGYFAFEPMNAKYNRAPPTIGGKFHRPTADTLTDDARKRLWAVEGVDPTLTDSFFICEAGAMHLKPFLDEVNDPFEIVARGNCVIEGNTQFGGLLIEATGNYEAVAAHAPTEQIEKE